MSVLLLFLYRSNFIQIGPESARSSALLDLVSHILSDPAYQQLRNVEQLGIFSLWLNCAGVYCSAGYIVWSFASRSNGVQSYRVLVQSKTFTPDFMDQRVEQFLYDVKVVPFFLAGALF